MDHIPKYEIPVRIDLAQEDSILGVIFLRQDQRILDMLCEPKPFFPVSTRAGTFLINKSSVVKVEVLDEEYILEHQENFPEPEEKAGLESDTEMARRRKRHLQSV